MKRFKSFLYTAIFLLNLLFSCSNEQNKAQQKVTSDNNFLASYSTKNKHIELKQYLNFKDTTDFANAKRGFIATIESGEILKEDQSVSYSMKQFEFLNKEAPDEANPSLWRQSQLNSINGLFEVTKGI